MLLLVFLLLLLLVLKLLLGSAFVKVFQACFLNEVCDAVISLLFEGVQVEAETSREEGRLLRDHRDLLPQIFQVKLGDVNSINLDVSTGELDNASQGHAEGRFSGTGTSHDSDLVTRLDLEAESVQDSLGVGAILELNIIELELSFGRPISRGLLSAFCDFLRDILEVEDALSLYSNPHEPV